MPVGSISTTRLELRDWTGEDGPAFHHIWGNPAVIWWGAAAALEESQGFLESAIERSRMSSWGWCAVSRRGETRIIGNVCLQGAPPWRHDVEIGWHFVPAVWGRGFATEAAALLLHAFESGIDRVVADIVPDNRRSAAVAERLGMRRTGVIERSGRLHEVWQTETPAGITRND